MNFLETIREARTPRNRILIGLGEAVLAGLPRLVPEIEQQIDRIAVVLNLDRGYFRYSLASPAGKRALQSSGHYSPGLRVLLSVWQAGGSATWGQVHVPPEGSEDNLFNAADALGAWSVQSLRPRISSLVDNLVKTKRKDMTRVLERAHPSAPTGANLTRYIKLRLTEAVDKRPQWFSKGVLLRTVLFGWSETR